MANEKVTQLPTVVQSFATDIIYAVQGGLSVQETLQQVLNLGLSNTILNFAGNPNGLVAGTTFQLLWDTTDSELFICTTSGSTVTAVWTLVSPGVASVTNPAHGGTGVASPTIHTLPVAQGASPFHFLGPLTNGQVLIGSTGLDPVPQNLSAGPGISITPGAGTIQISGTGSGIGWTEVTGTSQAMVNDNGYVANNGSLVTLTLPVTATFGTAISVIGKGAGGWLIQANGGQVVQVGASATSSGGSVASTNRFDSIDLICTTADTIWTTLGGVQGTLTLA